MIWFTRYMWEGIQANRQACNDAGTIERVSWGMSHLTYHSVGKLRHDCCSCHDDPILIIAVCRRFKSNGLMPCVLAGVKESEAAMCTGFCCWLLLRCWRLALSTVSVGGTFRSLRWLLEGVRPTSATFGKPYRTVWPYVNKKWGSRILSYPKPKHLW